MGWMETRAVDERMRFVMMVERQEQTFAAVCRRFGASCRTGHKWLTRANRRAEGWKAWSVVRGHRSITRRH